MFKNDYYEDLIFLVQAPMGIKNDFQKKKIIFYVRKYTLKNPIKNKLVKK